MTYLSLDFTKKTVLGALLINVIFVFPSFKPMYGNIPTGLKYLSLIAILCFCIFDILKENRHPIVKWLQFFLLYACTVGVITPFVFWGQSLFHSCHALIAHGGWLLFFYLKQKKYNMYSLEDSVIIASAIYTVCYLYMWTFHFDMLIYNGVDMSDANSYRMFFGNYYISIFAFYILLNRFFRTRKYVFLILMFVPLVVIIMIQTRQVLLIMAFILFVYISKNVTTKNFILIVVTTILIGIWVAPVVKGLYDKTKIQQKQNQSTLDIRFKEYHYYFIELNTSIGQVIFGNGIDQDGSAYNRYLRRHWKGPVADAGYAGIFNYWGLIGLAIFVTLYVIVLRIKVHKKYRWLFISMISMAFFNLASFAIRSGIIILPLYGYYLLSIKDSISYEKLKRILHRNRLLQL